MEIFFSFRIDIVTYEMARVKSFEQSMKGFYPYAKEFVSNNLQRKV